MSFSQESILLFRQLAGGGERSFKDLYAYYVLPVMRLCRHITRDAELGQEACMDTFMVLWEKRSAVAAMERPAAWLFQTARNTSYNTVRKLIRLRYLRDPETDMLTLPSGMVSASERMELMEFNGQLQSIIQTLAPRQRQVIVLKLQGFDRADIARICGVTKDTVKGHLTTAYDRLRNKLNDLRTKRFE